MKSNPLIVGMACLCAMIPQSIMAAGTAKTPSEPKQKVVDIALGEGGLFAGRAVDNHGVPVEGAVVVIRSEAEEVARTITDKDGVYTVDNMRGGFYLVSAGQGAGMFRLWAPGTAPPAALNSATVVSKNHAVRGQVAGGMDAISMLVLGGTAASTTFGVMSYNEAKDARRAAEEAAAAVSP